MSTGTEGALAAKQATSTIPVVMATGDDPVARGVVMSLAKPGGNVTGLTSDAGDIAGKRLELLKETLPSLRRVGVLGTRAIPVPLPTSKKRRLQPTSLKYRSNPWSWGAQRTLTASLGLQQTAEFML